MSKEGVITCLPGRPADIRFQDGGLRHAVGVKSYQALRATRRTEHAADSYGWTYNHAPMLAWWNGRYFLEYLSNPVSEHVAPGQVLLTSSRDGAHWLPPRVVFPAYDIPSAPYRGPKKELLPEIARTVPHHRMGFYISSENRLLASSFYGFSPDGHLAPNNGYGVGRVVCEVSPDLSMSAVYFIRYNAPGGFDESNTPGIAFYQKSPDAGFIAACDELLANRLVTQQWWEEEQNDRSGFFTRPDGRALCFYTAKDGAALGVFKEGKASETWDNGETWSELHQEPTISTSDGKVWGQRTNDGRYALAYNPSPDSAHRWPLAVIAGGDGRRFENLLAVTPEVSPCRYAGKLKNLGPQYIRGICEANPQNPGPAMWLCYSVNKEDIWVSKIPLPITGTVDSNVDDRFGAGCTADNWNLYVPAWCPVEIETAPDGERCLCLHDADRYDRARAERAFPESAKAELSARFMAGPATEDCELAIEVQDEKGAVAVAFRFDYDGAFRILYSGTYNRLPGLRYEKNKWIDLALTVDCKTHMARLDARQGGAVIFEGAVRLSNDAPTVERVVFMTKSALPFQTLADCGKLGDLGDLPGGEEPTVQSVYRISSLTVKTNQEESL